MPIPWDWYGEVKELRENSDLTWQEISDRIGYRSGEAVRSRFRLHRKFFGSDAETKAETKAETESSSEDDSSMVEFLDRKRVDDVDWREIVDLALKSQDLDERTDDTQRVAEIRIKTNKPIAIVFSGDWHLGDSSTDHSEWMKDISYILENKNFYLMDLGDDRQNARSFRSLAVVLSQAITPTQQAILLRGVVDELTKKEKLLAKVDGNHDVEWDERIFGEALQRYLLEKMTAPRFRNRGLLKLYVGNELYTLLLFHKSRFRSIFRATHGSFREYQFGYPADIVAGGHDHVPAFELMPSYQLARDANMGFGGGTYLIKVGTYQDSNYGWKYYHNGGKPARICVVLWPEEHRMAPFFSMNDASRFLETF